MHRTISSIISWQLVVSVALAVLAVAPAQGEVTTLRVARQYGIGYLQMMVMEHEKLFEKRARADGLGDVDVAWTTFGDGAIANDAMLSGNLDFAAGGLGSFATLWDRTRGSLAVKGVAALNSMPMLLVTRNPRIRTIADYTDEDRIAVAGVKVSSQATTLQLASAQRFGDAHWGKLDSLTINMAHPTAVQAMVLGKSEVTSHFASPPYQYDELTRPGMRTVLNSYDVWGGPQTFILVWTHARFRDDNPRIYAAFLAALGDATAFVNGNRRAAAAIYLQMSGDKAMSVDTLAKMLDDPQLRFTLVPENVVKFVAFKARIGTIRTTPESWKDLFFADIHGLRGN